MLSHGGRSRTVEAALQLMRRTGRTPGGRTGAGREWDAAVRWIFEKSGLRHAYWEAHGHGTMDVSHVCRGQKRWFDHMFVSDEFHVEKCDYLHQLRGEGCSDHSALCASLTFDTQVHGWNQPAAVNVNIANIPMPTEEERAEMRALDAKLDAFAAMLKRGSKGSGGDDICRHPRFRRGAMPSEEERAEMRALDRKLDAFAAMLKRRPVAGG